MSPGRISKHRLKKWMRLSAVAGMALAVLVVLGTVGYQLLAGWRARDLAAKARANFESANYRMAWLQINSAKELSETDDEVLRVAAMIEAGLGRASALDYYEKLSTKTDLTTEDLLAKARVAVRFGNDAQFAGVVADLESAGLPVEAGNLRAARKLRQGDLDRAIAEARQAAVSTDDPALKLSLARLHGRRFQPEFGIGRNPSAEALAASAEMVAIIDALTDAPQRDEALAFGINEAYLPKQARVRWAEAAFEKVDASNPALLPSAVFLVDSGIKSPRQVHAQLRPAFDAAPLERRSAYALWLTGAGMPKEALTLITAQEAGESTAAFGARTEALFKSNNLDAVLAACDAGGNIDADVRLVAKARAEYGRGRGAQAGAAALREAMDAAAKSGRLEFLVPTGDVLGASAVVDEKLAQLCGDPAVADYAFRVARDRFSRRGRQSLLITSLERTLAASPQSAAALDCQRYIRLLEGGDVALEETASAAAMEPANVTFRITHGLNLLKKGRSADALKAFDDVTVFANRLPPGQLAVIAAILAANGDTQRARSAADGLDPELLNKTEYTLIVPLRLPHSPRASQ